MSAAELKLIKHNLVNWIGKISDEELISFLNGIRIARSKEDLWAELSDTQKKQVLAGLKDADNGKVVSSQSFWHKLNNA